MLFVRCVACRKEFGPNDTVYRTSVDQKTGNKPTGRATNAYGGWGRHNGIGFWQAPVCEACRPMHLNWSDPVPCAGCGRPLRCSFKRFGEGAQTCSYGCELRRLKAKRQARRHAAKTQRLCAVCQTPFVPKRGDAKTCSHKCRQKAYRERVTDNKSPQQQKRPTNLLSVTLTDAVTDEHRVHQQKRYTRSLSVTRDG
jgi:hypothetical protein